MSWDLSGTTRKKHEKYKQKQITLQKRGCACERQDIDSRVKRRLQHGNAVFRTTPRNPGCSSPPRHLREGGTTSLAAAMSDTATRTRNNLEYQRATVYSRHQQPLHPTAAGEVCEGEGASTCAILSHSGKCCFALPRPWSHPFPLSLPSQTQQLGFKGPSVLIKPCNISYHLFCTLVDGIRSCRPLLLSLLCNDFGHAPFTPLRAWGILATVVRFQRQVSMTVSAPASALSCPCTSIAGGCCSVGGEFVTKKT